jgi:hypothetical protein
MIKPEELLPLMILEWIKGDKQGQQEIINNVDVQGEFVWVNFEGGGRINGHVINEMMVLIGVAQPEDVAKHQEQKDGLVELEPQVLKAPTPVPVPQTPVPTNTFGFDILDKANRDSKMELNLLIGFDFISEDKIKMLLELYGEELFASLKEYVRQQLSEDVINGCIEQYLLHKFPQPEQVNKQETLEVEQVNEENHE